MPLTELKQECIISVVFHPPHWDEPERVVSHKVKEQAISSLFLILKQLRDKGSHATLRRSYLPNYEIKGDESLLGCLHKSINALSKPFDFGE